MLTVSLFFIVMFTALILHADSNTIATRPLPQSDKSAAYLIPGFDMRDAADSDRSSNKSVIFLRVPSTNSPGNIIGNTYAEYQQTGALGRKIARSYPPIEQTHMVWLSWLTPENLNLEIYYQVYETGYYVYAAGGIPASYQPNTSESSLGILPDNRVVIGNGPNFGLSNVYANIEFEMFPGVFIEHPLLPDTLSGWYVNGMQTRFPATEVHTGADTVIYILTSSYASGSGYLDLVLYRKVGEGDFDNGQMIESMIGCWAYTIVARQNTDSVAMIYFEYPVDGGSDEWDRDIVYRLSTDQGLSWGPQISISNYTPDSMWRANVDVSALWDYDGDLHVVWNAREKDSLHYWNYKCQILHWSTAHEQTSIITEARYSAECPSNIYEMNAGKPSLSLCEGRLYVIWTQYNNYDVLNDCSENGFASGELYISASDDHGLTWDTAVDLTNTRTPGCAPGDCESDIYPSMIRYGAEYADARDSLDIIYINDKDAGIASHSEGNKTLNNVIHYRIPCHDVAHTSYCRPGDANDDRQINVGDAVYLIGHIFKGGPPPAPYAVCSGDANGDCQCNVGDAVYLISYVFKGGPAPIKYFDWFNTCGSPAM